MKFHLWESLPHRKLCEVSVYFCICDRHICTHISFATTGTTQKAVASKPCVNQLWLLSLWTDCKIDMCIHHMWWPPHGIPAISLCRSDFCVGKGSDVKQSHQGPIPPSENLAPAGEQPLVQGSGFPGICTRMCVMLALKPGTECNTSAGSPVCTCAGLRAPKAGCKKTERSGWRCNYLQSKGELQQSLHICCLVWETSSHRD